MPNYTHGGDIWSHKGVLDFSANLHPLGMPAAVATAARKAVSEATGYPDPLCRALREAIGTRLGVAADHIICSDGAAGLIYRLSLALRPWRAMVTAPTFSEYEQALSLCACRVDAYPLAAERGFDPDEGLLDAIDPGLDVLFLCNPNNPTGRLIDPALLEKIVKRCGECGTLLVVDECFLALTEGTSLLPAVADTPHLFLLRAFTKTYAVPGLRLGYGVCSNRTLLERLYSVWQPWPVSNVAQAAGIAACGCPDWPKRGRRLLDRERPRLLEKLRELGLEVWEGQANYLLFRAAGVTDLREKLLGKNILIRSCGNYRGLTEEYYRVCIRQEKDNDALIRALREVL